MVFNFLKKIFSSKEEKPQERVNLGELELWTEKERKQTETIEKNILETLKSHISSLVSELEEEIKVLETIDLKDKKVEEKVKLIVKENLIAYTGYLKKLVENINNIKLEKLEDSISKINYTLADFDKKSGTSYEKATFLIGKELGNVKSTVSHFFSSLKETLRENYNILERSRAVKNTESKFLEIKKIEREFSELDKLIESALERAKDKAEAIEILKKEIEKIKNSQAYLENQKRKENNEKSKEELKNKVQKLKESIDFKQLATVFHVNEKKMRQLKEYNENFYSELYSDRGEILVNLLKEAKINLELIERIKELAKKQREIAISQEKDETLELEREIKKIELEQLSLKSEKNRLEKARDKLIEASKLKTEEIRRELEKVNILLD